MTKSPSDKKKGLTKEEAGLKHGFRSGLEGVVSKYFAEQGVPAKYETFKIPYEVPSRPAKYTPDFLLPNGIIIETKGRFVTEDRKKMLLIKKQHPRLDIRMVFSNPFARISKTSATTYAKWCQTNGFPFSKGLPPLEWLLEPPNKDALNALKELLA